MMEVNSFDPSDLEASKEKINDGTAPCNIYRLIKEILVKLESLEARVEELEK